MAPEKSLDSRKKARVVAGVLLLQLALPSLLSTGAAGATCIVGAQPPVTAGVDWTIFVDTTLPASCSWSHNADIKVVGAVRFAVQGVLNVTGFINVSQGAIVEVAAGGAIHVRGGPPGVRLLLATGSVLHVEGTLELDGLWAPGTSNQANIEFIDANITARGYFAPTSNSVTIIRSSINVTAPPVSIGQNGGDAIMNLGGRITAVVSESTFLVQAAGGGVGTQGGRGGDGGQAIVDLQPKTLSYVSLRVVGGAGGKGGTGASGGSGGDGGAGGDAIITAASGSFSSSDICAVGGAGGNGAIGSYSASSSAGHGGLGRPGGRASFTVASPDSFSMTYTTVCVDGGNGGTGGGGGAYQGNDNTNKGGNGGTAASGGSATFAVSAPNVVAVSDSTIAARGAPGGLGGPYGLGMPSQAAGTNGKPGVGGQGGSARAAINSTGFDLDVQRTTVLARAGSGGDGGQGGLEGGNGGPGGSANASAYALIGVSLVNTCFNATGGRGGTGAAGSSISGVGGDGGDATVWINSTGTVEMSGGCLGALEGPKGPAGEPAREGFPGVQDLYLNAAQFTLSDCTLGNQLDDYKGAARSQVINCTFTRQFPGSPIIPLGTGAVDWLWWLDAFVNDAQLPIAGATISVRRPATNDNFFQAQTTDSTGHARFLLVGATFTSNVTTSTGFTYFVEAANGGETKEPVQVVLNRAWSLVFVFPVNLNGPVVTILQPRPQLYLIDDAHPNIEMVVKVEDPDDLLTGVPTIFRVWACIALEPRCFEKVEITSTRMVNNNTGEVTYNWSFNVTVRSEYPDNDYFACAQASDGLLLNPWNCVGISLKHRAEDRVLLDPSAGRNVRGQSTKPILFDGRVNNIDEIAPVQVLEYHWDFDGDGVWDYSSPTSGSTIHIFPQVANTTVFHTKFGVVDSLGIEYFDTRDVTIEPIAYPEASFLWKYAFVIFYTAVGAVAITVSAYTLQRRRKRIEEEESQRREAEILANIFECPRCGDLLPEKFAICVRCATEDAIAGARKTVAELKQVGVIVLEEEDMVEKAAVAFEGRDFQTANQFLDKVKSRVDVNRKRHVQTTRLIRRERLYIRMLQEQGRDLTPLEPELYHAELALGRSDFDGAEQMVEGIRKKIQAVVYEDKKREILERLTKLERQVKAFGPTDEASTQRAAESMKLLERAKVALGKRSYLEAVGYYTDAFTQMEGGPPEALVTEPTDTELDLFETRLKMQEEGVYMGPAAAKPVEEKVWRPGEKQFKVGEAGFYRPGEGAKTMTEDHAHGRLEGAAPAAAPVPAGPQAERPAVGAAQAAAPAPAVALPPAAPGPDVMEPLKPLATPAPAPAVPATQAPLKCVVCGTSLKPGWLKCPKCATPVPGAAAARAPATPPAGPPAPAPQHPAAMPSAPAAVADKCPQCAKPVKPAWKKCPYCAHTLHG